MTHLAQQQENIKKSKHVRYHIILMLFIVTAINYGDRAVLAIAGSPMADGR